MYTDIRDFLSTFSIEGEEVIPEMRSVTVGSALTPS